MWITISCQKKITDTFNDKTYLSDIQELKEKDQITSKEYEALKNYLVIKDSLYAIQGFSYKNILHRIENNLRNKRELEEKQREEERIKQLSKIAIKTQYVTIYFRDTPKEVERKIKIDADSILSTFYIRKGEKDYRIFLGDSKPYFGYMKGYGDNKERLNYFSITLDINSASTYKDYYVGETKRAFEKIIEYFEYRYGNTKYYYPELSSYGIGYGDRFTVAEWHIGRTHIEVEMYEERELYDKYGNYSYKTKYIVSATLTNFDKKLRVSEHE